MARTIRELPDKGLLKQGTGGAPGGTKVPPGGAKLYYTILHYTILYYTKYYAVLYYTVL